MGLELIAAVDSATVLNSVWTIAKVVGGLGFVIFVHELGHFLAAKFCGVKCEKFYVGFDIPISLGPIRLPRTLGKFTWGETEYGIGILPLGGYVKMLGQDDNPANAAREAERIRLAAEEGGPGAVELDPRSYPAKSVLQRMLIISAGVIMNVIFAVILAAIAYGVGVRYGVTEIGENLPGDPAWVADMPVGAKVLRIGQGKQSEHLRFDWDLRQTVAQVTSNDPVPFLLRLPDGNEETFEIRVSRRLQEQDIFPFGTIGMSPVSSTTLSARQPAAVGSPASRSTVQGRDRIIGVSWNESEGKSQTLMFDQSSKNEAGELVDIQLTEVLVQHRDKPLTLIIERPQSSKLEAFDRVEVELEPSRRRRFGLQMGMSPIVAIQEGSPAETAGLKPGDELLAVNGEPIGDPLELPQRMFDLAGQTVELTIRPQTGEEKNLKVTLRERFDRPSMGTRLARVGLSPLGVAYDVTNTVKGVIPDSPADRAGFKAGDRITQATFRPIIPDDDSTLATTLKRFDGESIEFSDSLTEWVYFSEIMQQLPLGTPVEFLVERSKKTETIQAATEESDSFYEQRGLILTMFERVHTASTWSEAFALGFRETKQKMGEIISLLSKLFTGQVSAKHLGGPLTIFTVAGSEAAKGIPSLLIFLTLLSVNLAIINFLPIPALDGGHMMFLTWELFVGKPVDEKWQTAATLVGVALLIGLMVFVTKNDVQNLFF